ncbi:NPC intracellular cholesterol transporter 2 homolog a-like [Thrips palmi]|uniref:NPC intracellular cholesterol transporter 2 homolog a-like n=1 Tax=Thrips palmi TaxID=161013 RepID=A0A6P8YHR6_THRPL|nr:NPC intracellular cholesterol transporter 2 homolog a-like [Thrips palmi]
MNANTNAVAVAACLACLIASALAAEFKNCAPNSDLGEWTSVSVLGCNKNDTLCTLRRDHSVTISIDFTNKKREWRVLASVHGVIAGLEMPFELKNPDACRDTGLTCPLNPGPHTYTYSLFVDKTKPRLRQVTVKWELLNEFKKPIVCVLIPARIR